MCCVPPFLFHFSLLIFHQPLLLFNCCSHILLILFMVFNNVYKLVFIFCFQIVHIIVSAVYVSSDCNSPLPLFIFTHSLFVSFLVMQFISF